MSFDSGTDNKFSLPAGADLSAKQYHAVVADSNGTLQAAGAGAHAIGLLQNKPASGQPGSFVFSGVSKAAIGGTVAAGAKVAANAAGKLVTAATGNTVVGIALAGGVSGDIVPVLVMPGATA